MPNYLNVCLMFNYKAKYTKIHFKELGILRVMEHKTFTSICRKVRFYHPYNTFYYILYELGDLY